MLTMCALVFITIVRTTEGGGSGGPSLLFRASNYDIVRQYADHAPFPHASVFASDAFGLGLLRRYERVCGIIGSGYLDF